MSVEELSLETCIVKGRGIGGGVILKEEASDGGIIDIGG